MLRALSCVLVAGSAVSVALAQADSKGDREEFAAQAVGVNFAFFEVRP
jgi:hypothetical protein